MMFDPLGLRYVEIDIWNGGGTFEIHPTGHSDDNKNIKYLALWMGCTIF